MEKEKECSVCAASGSYSTRGLGLFYPTSKELACIFESVRRLSGHSEILQMKRRITDTHKTDNKTCTEVVLKTVPACLSYLFCGDLVSRCYTGSTTGKRSTAVEKPECWSPAPLRNDCHAEFTEKSKHDYK